MKTVLVKNRLVREVDVTQLIVGDIFTYKDKQYRAASTSYERDGEVFIDVDTEGNAFWEVARQNNLEEKLIKRMVYNKTIDSSPILSDGGFMIQGELVAPNIQGNFEGVERANFYLYNIFDIAKGKYLSPQTTHAMATGLDIKAVPVLHWDVTLAELFPDATKDTIIQKILDYSDGDSSLGGKYREGIVFKRDDGQFSFKAISNRYLEKEKE